VVLTCRRILRRGTDGFTSHPKEVVLRIFIALKNPSNSRTLDPVASTITTRSPRPTSFMLQSVYKYIIAYMEVNRRSVLKLLVLGPQRDEVLGDGRKLHHEELRNLYFP
jgi:hypothetical protein